jgi:ESCRT-II complex subunit VPS22
MHLGGRSGLKAREEDEVARAALGLAHAEERARECTDRMFAFKSSLEAFAASHRAEIARDPEFRRDFVRLARSIGVDPLASSKSIWASTLGLGSFYFELGVRAASVCMATRAVNGGLISLTELTKKLAALGGSAGAGTASEDDVSAALLKLSVLGDGFSEIRIGNIRFIRSVPEVLSSDATAILTSCGGAANGGSSTSDVWPNIDVISASRILDWSILRTQEALNALVRDGVAWVDNQTNGGATTPRFYFPSLKH